MKAFARKPLDSILVKPAGPDCNMACEYCFYLEKSKIYPETRNHRMRDEILQETIRQALTQSGAGINIAWQGGEPTLVGLDFFKRAVQFEIEYGRGKSVGNGFQTNGLLLNEDWAEFLAEYKFLVGLSLDGPEHIHDRYRRRKSGEGSWPSAVRSAKLLLDRGVAVNALIVVNDHSVRYPQEIFEFHKGLGLTFMQFIPCVERDPLNPKEPTSFSVTPQDYGNFLRALFDLWLADFKDGEPMTSVRLFDSLFFLYVDKAPPECTLLPECGTYVVVEHNGDVYSCDFFVEGDRKLGNVMDGKLAHMLNSSRQKDFGGRKARLAQECLDCRWLKYCRGGCPKDRGYRADPPGLNYLCAGFKAFFEHADPHFMRLAKEEKGDRQLFPQKK